MSEKRGDGAGADGFPAERSRIDRGRFEAEITVQSARAVYVISVAAELAGMHPQTLRIYERKGLLEPSRTGGGSRRYSPLDIARLHHIAELSNGGLNIEGIKRVMELEAQVADLRSQLQAARSDVAQAVQATHRQYRRDLVPLDTLPEPYGFPPQTRRP